jgi:plasmid stability protein
VATLHVRNVPDDLYELLRERALANDRSIGAETVQLLYERLAAGTAAPRPFLLPGVRRRPARPVGEFTRFTTEARGAIVTAQQEARALAHGYVGTEHLLLGVLAQDVPVADALDELGLSLDSVRGELEPGDERTTGQMPFHPEAKRALEIALREAAKLGHTIIAPMHVTLGVAGASAGRGAQILRAAEPDEAKLRKCILGSLARPPFHPMALDTSFRVVLLHGEDSDWERQLNETAALGYELLEIVEGRAIFRRQAR